MSAWWRRPLPAGPAAALIVLRCCAPHTQCAPNHPTSHSPHRTAEGFEPSVLASLRAGESPLPRQISLEVHMRGAVPQSVAPNNNIEMAIHFYHMASQGYGAADAAAARMDSACALVIAAVAAHTRPALNRQPCPRAPQGLSAARTTSGAPWAAAPSSHSSSSSRTAALARCCSGNTTAARRHCAHRQAQHNHHHHHRTLSLRLRTTKRLRSSR